MPIRAFQRVFISTLALCFCAVGTGVARSAESDNFAVLVFSKTGGFRHDSIEAGVDAVRTLGENNGFAVDATEDNKVFTDERLSKYREVIFLSTTGEILDADERAAFERFVRRGGGFVGIHSASDTGYEWPWYGRLVGNYFHRHPAIQRARLEVVDASHPSTRHLPIEWTRIDEWYDFRNELDPAISVLIRIDEKSYRGGRMGTRHPMAWCHDYDGGRAWYTALGHTTASYSEPLFLEHILGGILWAAGLAPK
ncbi:MAG: ThuA domain-containing protein [Betaproteobacteria bacterium]